ncbi:MAG: Rid family detoxifying hydrolase [Thaumarchaeota archaeon]|nr:Rid family detoxifying hydrolase [Nitrososphaerota archaeon]
MKREVRSNSAPSPIGPYSQAVEAGAVYCAGQIGVNPANGELEQGIVAQTNRCLSNLEGVLAAAGLSLNDVVKTTVFLADLADYKQMNDEYARRFSAPFPARSTVQAAALPRGALVEIDAIAVH